tara:strand:- start:291 stop:1109 length:819 start_codon:yes stop_codon:yes gene_type:complete
MSINVTPIPRLIDLAAPAFTLGTANAAGSAATAVASDSTLLAFDTTAPAAVAASAVVGTATVTARRDHVHPGTTGAGTVVDEAITRFNGTGGSSLQGYTSASPTISDAGVITLTSGQIAWPATENASGAANVLDDYQIGSWTPQLADATLDPTGEGQGYSVQLGRYVKIGRNVWITGCLQMTSIGTLTGANTAVVMGLPFTSANVSELQFSVVLSNAGGLAITAGTYVSGQLTKNSALFYLQNWSGTTGPAGLTITQFSADGRIEFNGYYIT